MTTHPASPTMSHSAAHSATRRNAPRFGTLTAGSISVLALFMGSTLAAGAPFADKTMADAAAVLAASLAKTAVAPPKRTARDLRAEADAALVTDPRKSIAASQIAVGLEPADMMGWLSLAKALLAVKPEAMKSGEQATLPNQAQSAAYRAYELAKTPTQKADALNMLVDALKRQARHRMAISAAQASLETRDTPATRVVLQTLREEHGFRVTDIKVDANGATPRACVVFSEGLPNKKQVDWSSFVKVDGRDAQTVSAEGRQLCVDNLAHGRSYAIVVRAGLPSVIEGEPLLKTSELTAHLKDRTPVVRASGKAYVLPANGQQGIPLTTINAAMVGVEVYRVGDRGLVPLIQNNEFGRAVQSYEIGNIKERTGQKVYEGELIVPAKLNEEVTTAFPVSEALPKLQPGAYLLTAHVLPKKGNSEDRQIASQWFIVSDLGLTTYSGEDGLHTFVRSLTSAGPSANANVRLVARNNEVLGTATTDARGYARFDAKLHKGEGGLAPAMVVADTVSGDYAFLDVSQTAFDLTDRGVKGRNAPGPIDGYAYADRGVYRPGETVHLTALIRDSAVIAANVPTTMIISRPDGVEHRRLVLEDHGLGGRAHALALGASAMSGTWRAKFYTDPKADPISSVSFLVEDFVAERMDLKLTPASAAVTTDGGSIKIAGTYLYGPPAANLAVEGEVIVRPAKAGLAAYPGFQFGLADEKTATVREALEGLSETAADGTSTVQVKLPKLEKTARPLEADVIVKLREASGRTIERRVTLPVELGDARIGIKAGFADNQAREGETETFQVIVLDKAGKSAAEKGLKWELMRLEQRWQWMSNGGNTSYEMQTYTRRVTSGVLDIAADKPAEIGAKLDWGRYRLEVKREDGSLVSSYAFNAGWHADDAVDSPEMLDIALDKPTYKSGDVARVKVSSRFAGKALVSVLGGKVHSFAEADIAAGGGEVSVPVSKDWGAGAYVAVTLYRPLDGAAKRMPGRAMGLRWLAVDQDTRTLEVAIQVPDKVKPGSAMMVPVKVAGLTAGEEARVTLSTVDIGILNLTRFEAPKPQAWFYGQRKLGLDIRDYYSRLIDGMRAEKGRLRSGGDISVAGNASPPTEATLALFSGIVKVDANGIAQIPVLLPAFNGAVRLSAVAWSRDKVGSSSKDMLVRDAIALTVTGPRFLTLGDTARLSVDLHNVEGPAADYKVTVTFNPVGGLPTRTLGEKTLALKAGEKKIDSLQLKPTDLGRMPLMVTAVGPNGITVQRPMMFDVKPPSGDIRRTTTVQLAAKDGKVTLSQDLLQDLIPGSAKATVHVGPMASLDVAGILSQLDRYPHGCAEQTTSRAMPLLYANDVARQIGMGQDADLKERLAKAVERLFEMQDSSGAFGIWGPSDGDMWLTAYVTDFLLRAREGKVAVDGRNLKLALDRLQNFVGFAQDFDKGGESRAYALYVLARGGRAPSGELRYYVDARMDRFTTPLALAHLGAAASLLGDKARSETAFAAAMKALDKPETEAFRADYGSNLRDRAAVITLASETKMTGGRTPQLIDVLAKGYAGKPYTSTQEQAWLLLAARALGDEASSAQLSVNGAPHQGKLIRAFSSKDLATPVVIGNEADTGTSAVISVIGNALTPEPAVSKGFKITRSYYSLDGKLFDLKSATGGTSTLKQNDRLVVVVKVEADQAGGRIMLVDRLPAGLEVENPRLVDSGDVKTLDWLKAGRKPQHTDFRDDKVVAAFDFFATDGTRRNRNADDDADGEDAKAAQGPVKEATVAYIVRAVTPGSFVHPAATVEDMYKPDRHARTATGRLEVTGK